MSPERGALAVSIPLSGSPLLTTSHTGHCPAEPLHCLSSNQDESHNHSWFYLWRGNRWKRPKLLQFSATVFNSSSVIIDVSGELPKTKTVDLVHLELSHGFHFRDDTGLTPDQASLTMFWGVFGLNRLLRRCFLCRFALSFQKPLHNIGFVFEFSGLWHICEIASL